MKQSEQDKVRQNVRQSYAKVAEASEKGEGCGVASSCCGVPSDLNTIDSTRMGYSTEEVQSVPDGADMGLGCGNPGALAGLKPGETVVDLGSGGGFDCFLAAKQVGENGKVIGVDMTPAMISKARGNIEKTDYKNVEFRLGEIEHLPIADNSVDIIISNCVINLSPNKQQVFDDAFRILKCGGRLAISDVVASTTLPDKIRSDLEFYSGCMAGASEIEDLNKMLLDSGFVKIQIEPNDKSRKFIKDWAPGKNVDDYVLSASITAIKPESETGCC